MMYRVTSIDFSMGRLVFILLTIRLMPAVTVYTEDGIFGYDCGKPQQLTTLSLLDIDDCGLEVGQVKTSTEKVALLQLNKYDHVEIVQCRVEITRTVFYCGMSSHDSISFGQYILPLSSQECRYAIQNGKIPRLNAFPSTLKVDETVVGNITMAGNIAKDGTCMAASFTDPLGSWSNVVALGSAKITLKTAHARANIDSDTIYLPFGTKCKLSDQSCTDATGSSTFWNAVPQNNCTDKTYSILYRGDATKFESNEETVYSVNVGNTSISFKATAKDTSCGVPLYKTESSKLFLIRSEHLNSFPTSSIVDMHDDNIHLFDYINAKFLYVEPYVRRNMKSLYLDVLKYHCNLEKEKLKNTLAIADTQPDEFALEYMESRGYLAVRAGEVIHIVKCLPVPVKVNHVDKCYNRLPVLRGTDSVYLTPRTHIISKYATEMSCNSIMRTIYRVQGDWYSFTPHPVPIEDHFSLKPSTKVTWIYKDLTDLAHEGIYTKEAFKSMSKQIMTVLENTAVMASVANLFTNSTRGPISHSNVFDSDIKEELAEIIWSHTWGKYIMFSRTSAIWMGIFVCISLLITIVDSVINFSSLYKVYGCSFYILAAPSNVVSNLLLLRPKKKNSFQAVSSPANTLNLSDDGEKRNFRDEDEKQE